MEEQIDLILKKLDTQKAVLDDLLNPFLSDPEILDKPASSLIALLYQSENPEHKGLLGTLTFRNLVCLVDWSVQRKQDQIKTITRLTLKNLPRPKPTRTIQEKITPPSAAKPLSTQILDFLHSHPWSISAQLESDLDLPTDVILKHLSLLKQQGLIKTVGPEKNRRYALL